MTTPYTSDTSLDARLNRTPNNVEKLYLCEDVVAGDSYATVAAAKLGEVAISSGNYTGPSDLAGGGRKLVVDEMEITASVGTSGGEDLSIAHVDETGTEVLDVLNCNNRTVVASDVITIASHEIQITDPTSA